MSQGQAPYSTLVRQFTGAPPGKLYCLHGKTSGVFRVSLYMASHALLRGVPVALIDGTNRFDAYYIAEFARKVTSQQLVKRRVSPEQLLRQISVARAFTCYQMEATITERLPAFLKRAGAPIAIIFGLLDTFYDEQAPLFEVQASVGRIIAALHKLKADNIAVLLASLDVKLESKQRNRLFPRVSSAMDYVLDVREDESGYHFINEPLRHTDVIGQTGQRQRNDGDVEKNTGRVQGKKPASTEKAAVNREREEENHGQNSSNIYHGHSGRDGDVDQVQARVAQRGSGGAG